MMWRWISLCQRNQQSLLFWASKTLSWDVSYGRSIRMQLQLVIILMMKRPAEDNTKISGNVQCKGGCLPLTLSVPVQQMRYISSAYEFLLVQTQFWWHHLMWWHVFMCCGGTLMHWRHEAHEIYLISCFYLSWFSRIFDENSPMKVKSDCRFPAATERFPLICVTCMLALSFMRNEIFSPFKKYDQCSQRFKFFQEIKRSYWWHTRRMRYISSATIWYWKS